MKKGAGVLEQQRVAAPAAQTIADFGVWHLRQVDLLKSIDGEKLHRLTRLLKLREFRRGETIYTVSGSRDEHLQRLYFLLKGRVKISSVDEATGKELLLFLVKQGEPFGFLDAVGNENTDLRASALQSSLVAYVPRGDFDNLIDEAAVCSRLVKIIGERAVEVVARFEDLAFKSVPTRVARVLLRLVNEFPKKRPCGTCIDIPLRQQEIADLIAARREVVSTHLARLKRDGVLAFHDECVCIHDLEALTKLAE